MHVRPGPRGDGRAARPLTGPSDDPTGFDAAGPQASPPPDPAELDRLAAGAAPLAAVSVFERTAGLQAGAAARAITDDLLAWAAARGLGAAAEDPRPPRALEPGDPRLWLVRFDDPARAAALRRDLGVHVFDDDAEDAFHTTLGIGGARVLVSEATRDGADVGEPPRDVVRRVQGPDPRAVDPRSGVALPWRPRDAARVERLLAAAWRVS